MARHPALRSFEYWARRYRRTWRGTVVSSLLGPTMYLAAMGVGLGTLVNQSGQAGIGHLDYLVFLAPGLLAASAMQIAANESTWPVMGAIKWVRTYHAMLATPLRVIDVLSGHLAWIAFRLATSATLFLLVMTAFRTTTSATAVFDIPAAVLTGMAFSAPIAAFAATRENDQAFNAIFRFGVIPLFLFSGTFYPVALLPAAIRPIAYASPLWHGVALCRDLALGHVSLVSTVVHVLYLAGVTALGVWAASRTFSSRLER